MRKLTYLSGGMTGYQDFNYPFFVEKQKEMEVDNKYKILNPATDIFPMLSDGTELSIEDSDATWNDFLRGDIIAILQKCDSMFMTKGWLASKGAKFERFIAMKMGYKIEYQRLIVIEFICSGIITILQKVFKIQLKKPF